MIHMKNILFHKFMSLTDLERLQKEHTDICVDLHLLGKVILAPEGINGCLSGKDEDIAQYAEFITKAFSLDPKDIKITPAQDHTFRKLWIKIKPQIIGTKNWDANVLNKAEYIEPAELKQLLDAKEEVYIIDARNNYEYDSGHFVNALYPDIKTFSIFHELLDDFEHLKNKPVVTYCTGGVRCEKASAFLKEKGFTNVKQLHGGIINYAKSFGSAHWEGKCLVFDNRFELDMDDIKNSE